MSQHGYSIMQTIESNAIGAAVGAIVGGTVSGLYKRAVRLEARRIEAALLTLDHLLGGELSVDPILMHQKGTVKTILKKYRKGVEAGLGVVLIGVLTWATTDDGSILEHLIAPVVPPTLRPFLAIFVGGVVQTVRVIRARNTPAIDADADAVATAVSDVAALAAAPSSAARQSAALASLVAGVTATASAVTSETSVVKLLDPPVRNAYQ